MYSGNPNLRGDHEKVEYTKQMQSELIRCMADIIYFAEHYCHIVTIDHGKQLIKLWEFQKRMLKAYLKPPKNKRNLVVLAPRQCGKCCTKDTMIKIRNKKTGDVKEITLEEFHSLQKDSKEKPVKI